MRAASDSLVRELQPWHDAAFFAGFLLAKNTSFALHFPPEIPSGIVQISAGCRAKDEVTVSRAKRIPRRDYTSPKGPSDERPEPQDLDLGFDLEITKTTRRAAGAGTWVCGTLHGHRFEALVFPEHADNPEWEIGDSRISKLWIQRLADRRQVLHWDRGADVPAADQTVACIVDFLAGGLADFVYAD